MTFVAQCDTEPSDDLMRGWANPHREAASSMATDLWGILTGKLKGDMRPAVTSAMRKGGNVLHPGEPNLVGPYPGNSWASI